MSMKTIKVYLKNCPVGPASQIYCVKHQIGEDLTTFKEKIYKRCPNLRSAGDPTIYWFDLENDKIRITCDDDLKFFVEEAKIQKIFVQFEKLEYGTRKRSSAVHEEGDLPKRLRTKMEQIDLSSDSSSMELSDYDDEKESVTSTIEEATTSTQIDSEPIVKIISVDIIKEAEKPIAEQEDITDAAEEVTSEPVVIEEVVESTNEQIQLDTTENAQQRRPSDTNKIVISDSSDEDDTPRNNNNNNNNANNRRFSDGNYSTSYSFAEASNGGPGGRRYESHTHSASFDGDDFRRYNHHRRQREHFNEEARRTYRNCNENMQRMFQQAQSARDQAFRNFRNSAGLIPDLLSTFQSHFRPLFQQHQQPPPPPPRFNQNQYFQRF